MSKGFCGLHGLSTKKSAMTHARQHVNFMSTLIQHIGVDPTLIQHIGVDPLNMEWYTRLHIECGHMIRCL